MKKVLVIGDKCVDSYYCGTIDRISPEAPVPIINHVYKDSKSGMVGNVIENLKSLGIDCEWQNQTEPIEKIRFIDIKTKQQLLRYDIEVLDVQPFEADLIDWDSYSHLVISDYDKGFITYDVAKEICQVFNGTIFVDSKKKDLSCYSNCILKMNESEWDISQPTIDESNEVIVTLGAEGAKWKDKIFPSEKVEMFDVCGAGDVFLASFVSSYIKGKGMEESIKLANHHASVSVTKHGVYTLQEEDIAGYEDNI